MKKETHTKLIKIIISLANSSLLNTLTRIRGDYTTYRIIDSRFWQHGSVRLFCSDMNEFNLIVIVAVDFFRSEFGKKCFGCWLFFSGKPLELIEKRHRSKLVLTKHLKAAIKHARYEILKENKCFASEIPGFRRLRHSSNPRRLLQWPCLSSKRTRVFSIYRVSND